MKWLLLCAATACSGNPNGLGTTGGTTGGTKPLTLGQVCDPLAFPNGCALDGFVCVAQLDGGNFCGYAYLGDRCLTTTGCAPDSGLVCGPFPGPDGGTAFPINLCTLPCHTPSDCLDPGLDCFLETTDAGGCEFNACGTQNAPCSVGSDPNAGTCIAIDAYGDLLCLQNGTAPLGGACEETRRDGGSLLCGVGDGCLNGTRGEAVCVALCGGAAAPCPAVDICEETLGFCTPRCKTNADCSGIFTCQSDFDSEGNLVPDAGLLCFLP